MTEQTIGERIASTVAASWLFTADKRQALAAAIDEAIAAAREEGRDLGKIEILVKRTVTDPDADNGPRNVVPREVYEELDKKWHIERRARLDYEEIAKLNGERADEIAVRMAELVEALAAKEAEAAAMREAIEAWDRFAQHCKERNVVVPLWAAELNTLAVIATQAALSSTAGADLLARLRMFQSRVVSVTWGQLNDAYPEVAERIESHKWDNKNTLEQQEWLLVQMTINAARLRAAEALRIETHKKLVRLQDQLDALQEREAAICPEDVGFPEYCLAFERKLRAAEESNRQLVELLKGKVLVQPEVLQNAKATADALLARAEAAEEKAAALDWVISNRGFLAYSPSRGVDESPWRAGVVPKKHGDLDLDGWGDTPFAAIQATTRREPADAL